MGKYFAILFIILFTLGGCKRKDFYEPEVDRSIGRNSPSITLNGANSIDIVLGNTFNDPGATAVDADGNPLTIQTQTNINHNLTGSYYVNYTATDSYGVQSVVSRTVSIIVDATTWAGNWSVNHNCRTNTLLNLLKDPAVSTFFSNYITFDHDGRITNGTIVGQDITMTPSSITLLVTSIYQFTGTGRMSDDGNTIVIDYTYTGVGGAAGNGNCTATYTRQ